MEENLEDKCRSLKRTISWTEKMSNIFCYSDGYIDVLESLNCYLKKKLENDVVKEVKVLDLSYFNPETYYENHQKLLNELEDKLYIIDCRNVKTKENSAALGQLSSFYYVAKNKKTSFIYLFNSEDIRDYATQIEPYQMRSLVIADIDNDLKIYQLYQEMSEKYLPKNIKEKKIKI